MSAEQVTVGELEFYTNIQGVPYENGQAVPTTLHYTLHYRGTAAPTSSGNFDSYFAPIAFTATVDQVGTDISILPAQDKASMELIQGYYRLDFDTTGNPSGMRRPSTKMKPFTWKSPKTTPSASSPPAADPTPTTTPAWWNPSWQRTPAF